MESLQLSQVLADLSNIQAAEQQAASAIVNANVPAAKPDTVSNTSAPSQTQQQQQKRPLTARRNWSADQPGASKFDTMGRRILYGSPSLSRPSSTQNSTPGTPRRGDSDGDDDLERASALMALYDLRTKIKQQDNSNLFKAREKINALVAKQQAQQTAERNAKAAEEARLNRYSYPRSGP